MTPDMQKHPVAMMATGCFGVELEHVRWCTADHKVAVLVNDPGEWCTVPE